MTPLIKKAEALIKADQIARTGSFDTTSTLKARFEKHEKAKETIATSGKTIKGQLAYEARLHNLQSIADDLEKGATFENGTLFPFCGKRLPQPQKGSLEGFGEKHSK